MFQEVRVFAGVKQNRRGDVYPSGTGRLCNWTPDQSQPMADEFASFGAYQRTLTLECDEGEPGVVQWTPDENTPDTVYYQCYTHRYLGWKINVLDSCDSLDESASEQVASVVSPDDDQSVDEDEEEDDLQGRPSIQVNVRVKPNDVFGSGKEDYSYKTEEKNIEDKGYSSQQSFGQSLKLSNEDDSTSYNPTTSYQREKVVNAQQYNYNHNEEIEEAFVPPPFQREVNHHQYIQYVEKPTFVNNTKTGVKEEIIAETSAPSDEVQAIQEHRKNVITVKAPYVPLRQQYPMMHPHGVRVPLHPMAFNRGPQFSSNRRPLPFNSYPPQRLPTYRPGYKHQQTLIKKPFYRVPVQTPQMSQHRPAVVPFHRPMLFQQNPSQYTTRRPQKPAHFTTRLPQRIIPVQQAAPSKVYHKTVPLPKPEIKLVPVVKSEQETDSRPSNMMISSTLIRGNRPLINENSYEAAINTGFKPETVIVEGGFKPIVNINSKDVAQDRSSQLDPEMEYNEQEVKAEEPERQQTFDEDLNLFEGLQHEMFEPMFIPSPTDRIGEKKRIKPSISDDLTPPKNRNGNRKNSESYMTKIRPGLVRRPFYPNNLVPPFRIPVRGGSPSFRQASEDSEDELAMAAERQDTYYLPPGEYTDPQPGTVVTYDGKAVADVNLPPSSIPVNNYQLSQNSDDLLRAPQFGPFLGEIPPPIPSNVRTENIPQLSYNNRQQTPELPAQFQQGQNQEFPDPPPIRTTHLTLVRQLEDESKISDELFPEASELKEMFTERPSNVSMKNQEAPATESDTQATTTEEEEQEKTQTTENVKRNTELRAGKKFVPLTTEKYEKLHEYIRGKRSADHEPGHVGPHDHHDHHDHHDKKSTSGAGTNKLETMSKLFIVLVHVLVVQFL